MPHEGRNETFKMMLKRELKKFPLVGPPLSMSFSCYPFVKISPGWPMQESMFWFLSRQWNIDQPNIDAMLRHNHNKNYPMQLLIFPEGTDKTKQTTAKSDDFAKKNNLDPLRHVLYPRETGFIYVTKALRDLKDIDAVYDLTLAYSPIVPQSELTVFTGFPTGMLLVLSSKKDRRSFTDVRTEFHVNVRRFDIASLPKEESELSAWLRQRWVAKEALLDEFSRTKSLGDAY